MLYFTNSGELDPRLTQLFGASVKSETAIGKFGTGLKYAIATVLRLNGSITIHSGLTEYKFTSRSEVIRGKEFNLIYMNNTQMPFTTDLGKHWEPWMAYRELWANAQDEAGSIGTMKLSPTVDNTIIVVDCKELEEAHNKRHTFILEIKKPLWQNDFLEIHREPSTAVFYRHIKVLDLPRPSKFTYNILSEQELTEDRTLSEWSARHTIMSQLQEVDLSLLEQIAIASDTTFESKFDFTDIYFPRKQFLENISELASRRALDINQTMLAVTIRRNGVEKFQEASLTTVEAKMLAKAQDFCATIGYSGADIKIATHLGVNVLGVCVNNSNIWLSKLVFQSGTKQVAATLLEEYLHRDKKLPDQSREMQNFLLNWVVSLLEEKTGEPL